MKFYTLNNENKIPALGLGTYKNTDKEEVVTAVKTAIQNGVQLIDTAEFYSNENYIGSAISDFKRDDLFITTKVWNSEQGYDSTLRSFERSLNNLKTDYLDLYLIHWPKEDKMKDTWKAFEKLYEQGVAKNIGVSNFHKHHLEKLFVNANFKPVVNQIELHPYFSQLKLREFCNKNNILIESWSPIAKGRVAEDSVLKKIGEKYDKTAVQITVRWHIQLGFITIPKSVKPERIIKSIDVFDFELTDEDMKKINDLNKNERLGPDPDNFDF